MANGRTLEQELERRRKYEAEHKNGAGGSVEPPPAPPGVAEIIERLERVETKLDTLLMGQSNTATILVHATSEISTFLADIRRLGPVGWSMQQRKRRRNAGPS